MHIAAGPERGAEEITRRGFVFHQFPLSRRTLSPLADAFTLRALRRLYEELQPDIVHHVTWKPIIYGSLAAIPLGLPVLINAFAGLGSLFVGRGVFRRLRRGVLLRLLALSKKHPNTWAIFENSDDQAELVSAGVIEPTRSLVTPGIGIDVNAFSYVPEIRSDSLKILFASRLIRDKGVEDFVEAARVLRKRGVAAQFQLLGSTDPGNPSSISTAELMTWVNEGLIEWRGFTADIRSALEGVHIVCLPTRYREGVPRILMEAAAVGRPIITTDSPGCRDIVAHGVNGLLIRAGDVEALVQAIVYLAENPLVRTQFGQSGRRRVEDMFAVEFVLSSTMQLYSDALAKMEGWMTEVQTSPPTLTKISQ